MDVEGVPTKVTSGMPCGMFFGVMLSCLEYHITALYVDIEHTGSNSFVSMSRVRSLTDVGK